MPAIGCAGQLTTNTCALAGSVSVSRSGSVFVSVEAYATRTYAKVDLVGLREVAAFDLGELS